MAVPAATVEELVAPWAVKAVGEGSVLSDRFQTLEQTLCILEVLAVKTEGEILEATALAVMVLGVARGRPRNCRTWRRPCRLNNLLCRSWIAR